MNKYIKIGDKVYYRTVAAGTIKAIVVNIHNYDSGITMATIKVTSRKNRIYPYGYTFETSTTFMYRR